MTHFFGNGIKVNIPSEIKLRTFTKNWLLELAVLIYIYCTKVEAVQRLEAVEREAQRLETIREAANKERRRLLHTRTGKVDIF